MRPGINSPSGVGAPNIEAPRSAAATFTWNRFSTRVAIFQKVFAGGCSESIHPARSCVQFLARCHVYDLHTLLFSEFSNLKRSTTTVFSGHGLRASILREGFA
jgi:hypothetical protein